MGLSEYEAVLTAQERNSLTRVPFQVIVHGDHLDLPKNLIH